MYAKLVLSRRPGEFITIYTKNEKITVQVCRIEGNQVKVGVEAPVSVQILRDELAEKRGGENYR